MNWYGRTYTFDTQEELNNYYGTNFNYENDFNYADDKYKIENSINKYKGFYVGRYETTVTSAGVIGSMANENVLTAFTSLPQCGVCRWYGLYKVQKDLYNKKDNVFSRMITSNEWDMILLFTEYDGKRASSTYTTKPDKSGSSYKDHNPVEYDVSKNIYDLAGNLQEWTLTKDGEYSRVTRGSYYGDNGLISPAAYKSGWHPPSALEQYGSRLSLYIE